jgi:hypothetical protein
MIEKERIQELFAATLLHFNGKYDFFKYGGKVKNSGKISPSVNFFRVHKFANEADLVNYFLANQIQNYLDYGRFGTYLPALANEKCLAIYQKFTSDMKKFEVNLRSELDTIRIKGEFNKLKDLQYVLQAYLGGKITIGTIICFLKFTKFDEEWEKSNDPLVEDFLKFLKRIEPFFKVTRNLFLQALKQVLDK